MRFKLVSFLHLLYNNISLTSYRSGGRSGVESLGYSCFRLPGHPVKTVDRITYIVLVQTLNRAQSINRVTRCRLTPAEIIRINLILLATRVIWLHLRR